MAKLSIEELTSNSMSFMSVVRICVWAKSFGTTENCLLMDLIVWFRSVLWVFRMVMETSRRSVGHDSGISYRISGISA